MSVHYWSGSIRCTDQKDQRTIKGLARRVIIIRLAVIWPVIVIWPRMRQPGHHHRQQDHHLAVSRGSGHHVIIGHLATAGRCHHHHHHHHVIVRSSSPSVIVNISQATTSTGRHRPTKMKSKKMYKSGRTTGITTYHHHHHHRQRKHHKITDTGQVRLIDYLAHYLSVSIWSQLATGLANRTSVIGIWQVKSIIVKDSKDNRKAAKIKINQIIACTAIAKGSISKR